MDILEDLHAKGLINDEEIGRARSIEDIQEQRMVAADIVKKGLDDGTVKPENLGDDSRVINWVGLRNEQHDKVNEQTKKLKAEELDAKNAVASAVDEMVDTPASEDKSKLASAFEIARIGVEQSESIDSNPQQSATVDITATF